MVRTATIKRTTSREATTLMETLLRNATMGRIVVVEKQQYKLLNDGVYTQLMRNKITPYWRRLSVESDRTELVRHKLALADACEKLTALQQRLDALKK